MRERSAPGGIAALEGRRLASIECVHGGHGGSGGKTNKKNSGGKTAGVFRCLRAAVGERRRFAHQRNGEPPLFCCRPTCPPYTEHGPMHLLVPYSEHLDQFRSVTV